MHEPQPIFQRLRCALGHWLRTSADKLAPVRQEASHRPALLHDGAEDDPRMQQAWSISVHLAAVLPDAVRDISCSQEQPTLNDLVAQARSLHPLVAAAAAAREHSRRRQLAEAEATSTM